MPEQYQFPRCFWEILRIFWEFFFGFHQFFLAFPRFSLRLGRSKTLRTQKQAACKGMCHRLWGEQAQTHRSRKSCGPVLGPDRDSGPGSGPGPGPVLIVILVLVRIVISVLVLILVLVLNLFLVLVQIPVPSWFIFPLPYGLKYDLKPMLVICWHMFLTFLLCQLQHS